MDHGAAGDKQSDGRAQVGQESPLVGQEGAVDGQFVAQEVQRPGTLVAG